MKVIYVIDPDAAEPYVKIKGHENGEFETEWDEELAEYIAQDAAENLHDNGDYQDCNDWPMTFHIYSVDDEKLLGSYSVDMEYSPVFRETKVRLSKEGGE
jgi:hypothetical protein